MRLEEKFINYVRNSVDLSVGNTGYPILGRYLEEAGIATRNQLRNLVKKGHLKETTVKHNNGKMKSGTLYKAYYTERVIPPWVTKQEALLQKKVEPVAETLEPVDVAGHWEFIDKLATPEELQEKMWEIKTEVNKSLEDRGENPDDFYFETMATPMEDDTIRIAVKATRKQELES